MIMSMWCCTASCVISCCLRVSPLMLICNIFSVLLLCVGCVEMGVG